MILDFRPEDVSRIDRVVPPVGDRRDRKSRQKPFPEITDKEDPKPPAAESPPPVDDHRPPETDDDDQSIDLLVLPLSLPTRQALPSLDASILLH